METSNYKTKYEKFANQKTLTIRKEKCDETNIYEKINLSAKREARKNLTLYEFLLWDYFAENQDNYTFILQSKLVWENLKMSESSFHRAYRGLETKGYIITDKSKTCQIFVEKPVFSQNTGV